MSNGTGGQGEARIPFRVRYCSSFDENLSSASALEVAHPQSQGWISAGFCSYPQEIILELERASTIRQIQILSHQSLIATRIELYIGQQPDDYSRLGYMSLDPNTRSLYKARELKTVDLQLNEDVKFLKLIIHKNHDNDVNIRSQVGLVALKVLGRKISSQSPADLSVDMECDPETTRLIRELHDKKLRAVQVEDYDEAKRLKHVIDSIRSVGAQLSALEADKILAVQREDYDTAKIIKNKMNQIRRQHSLLDQLSTHSPGARISRPASQQAVHYQPPVSPIHVASQPGVSVSPVSPNQVQTDYYSSGPHIPYDERPLPAQLKHIQNSTDPQSAEENPHPFGDRVGSSYAAPSGPSSAATLVDPAVAEPSPISDLDRSQFSELIESFGEPIISLLLSKKVFQHRINALDEIDALVVASRSSRDADFRLISNVVQAINIALPDPICQVSVRALCLTETLIDSVLPDMALSDIIAAMEPVMPTLLSILDLSSGRAREKTRHVFDLLIDYPALIARYVTKPLRTSEAHKPLQGRVELLTILVESAGLSDDVGLRLDHIVTHFALPALRHKKGSTRQAGVNLTVALHSRVGNSLLPYLEGVMNPKLEATLMKTFQERQLHHRHIPDELSASNVAVPALPSLSPITIHNRRGSPPQRQREQSTRSSTTVSDEDEATVPVPSGDNFSEGDDESICRFCGKRDPQFTIEENLDLHYWMHCPMLVSCKLCEQVVEIPTLSDHLMNECEAASNVVMCIHCQRPLCGPQELQEHESACPGPRLLNSAASNQCPLCFKGIGAGEDGWRTHLLEPPGCKNNARQNSAIKT
uniref:TOG domain-containing protein n=1 Tax=Spongospora subterranea TaxID=70186 RepID=A0A0H5RAE2_9EUKA|eukprot:CRZ10761.1 hypothetical protein [Spongospora subterranea]